MLGELSMGCDRSPLSAFTHTRTRKSNKQKSPLQQRQSWKGRVKVKEARKRKFRQISGCEQVYSK